MRALPSEQLSADQWMIRQYRRFQGHDILDTLGASSQATSSSGGGGGLSPHGLLGTYHVDAATYLNQALLTTSSPTFASVLPTVAVGAAAGYVPNSYLTRMYVNATAYLDGATAGAIGVTGKLNFSATASAIQMDTSDGSDSKAIQIAGGGVPGSTRGAYIVLRGNEYATNPGKMDIVAGYSSGTTYANVVMTCTALNLTGDLGLSSAYVPNAYITRYYLNSTAYIETGAAGWLGFTGNINQTGQRYSIIHATNPYLTLATAASGADQGYWQYYTGQIAFSATGTNFITFRTTGADTERIRITNAGHLVPGADSTYTLGDSTPLYWLNISTDRLTLNPTAYLDGATAGYADLTGKLRIKATTGQVVFYDTDTSADIWTVGTYANTGLVFREGITDRIHLATGGHWHPLADSAQDLGTATGPLYWRNAYIDRVYLNSTAYLDGANAGRILIVGAIDSIQMTDAANIALGTTTGTKIGTATGQKIAFHNATPVVQAAHIADATDLATALTRIAAILVVLENKGFTALA